MKKLIIALSIVLSAGFVTKSYAQEVITIQQAIEKTLNNNLQNQAVSIKRKFV